MKEIKNNMFIMVLINEIIDCVIDIDKETDMIYIDEKYIDFVNGRLEDFGFEMTTNSIDLKDVIEDYSNEHIRYIFDDVWCSYDCL